MQKEQRRNEPTGAVDPVAVASKFESAWKDALSHLDLPDLDSFLSQVDPNVSEELRAALESIDDRFRQQLTDARGADTVGNFAAETIVTPALSSDAAATGAFPADAPAEVQQTADFPAEVDRHQTADFEDRAALEQPAADPNAKTRQVSGQSALEAEVTFVPSDVQQAHESDEQTWAGDQITGRHLSRTAGGSGAESAINAADYPVIPGFKILGVLGRGGMGIVYRAIQTDLKREVALKMILKAGESDPQMLARFQAEAEAVAHLQHSNIVQIYATGQLEGLPYFALEFVEGQSLEDVREAKAMDPRRASSIVQTLAQAMHYAHERGIVHRDLKPANVLVSQDGVPKVTDFGLVKRVEDDSGRTRVGAIMGTPSYMAPEQAWGQTNVGPPADIYALGGILYSLLTGRPAFMGSTSIETIVQLREEEPVAPSRLQKTIPRDLETICMKCLEKLPEKRYASAAELADDLRRFLAGEPIQARPVSRLERTWRWCLRNRHLAIAAGVAVILGISLMIGGPAAALVINQEREAAVDARELAVIAQGEAEASEELAVQNELKALQNEELARQQRNLAIASLETLIERVPKDLRNIRGTDRIKQALLLTAMDGVNKIADASGDETKEFLMAKAHAKMGESLMEVGLAEQAQDQFEKSHQILIAESVDQIGPETHLLRLGRSYRNLGRAAERLEGPKAAVSWHTKSLDARQQALEMATDPLFVKQEIAAAHGQLGRLLLAMGDPRAALKHFEQSGTFREEWLEQAEGNVEALRENAGFRLSLGHAFLDLNEPDRSIEHYEAALRVLEKLTAGAQIRVTDRANVALCYDYLGGASLLAGDPETASIHYSQAVERLDALTKEAPRMVILQRKLAKAHYGMGVALQQSNATEKGREHLEAGLKIRQELNQKAPEDVGYQQDLMISLARLGQVEPAIELGDKLKQQAGDDPGVLYNIACGYALCGAADSDQAADHHQQAIESIEQAIEAGFKSAGVLLRDPDLKSLQDLPRFQELIKQLQAADSADSDG